MTPTNKKPGAVRKSPAKRHALTPRQRAIHHKIETQSQATQISGRPYWLPEQYPELYALLDSAKCEARSRRRLKGRIVFRHEGKVYAACFTSLDRIIVEDEQTGRFIASSGFFAL